jgi:NADH dehydrogenase/NADH:ubiquinone oxidoreductase subunit G
MCDIGRFQYLWVEGEQRLRRPLINTKEGVQQTATWKDALMRVRDLLNAAGRKDPASVRMLASAHASHEEMYLLKRLAEDLKGDGGASHVHVAWRRTEKPQPANTKFRVPTIDAPNVNGAKDLGLSVVATADGDADLSALRTAIDQDRVAVLYVVDPGPDGSLGDVSWLAEARKSGRVPVIIYQGVLQTELAKIADVVLPGAAWVEKDATYTNDQGMVQAASKAINAPGESVEDWQILTCRTPTRRPSRFETTWRHTCRRCRSTPRWRKRSSTVRSVPSTGSRPATRWNAGSGTRCSRTCRRSRATTSRWNRCHSRP